MAQPDLGTEIKNVIGRDPAFRQPPGHQQLAQMPGVGPIALGVLLVAAQHLKAAWKPLLFTDEHRPTSPDPVAKAVRSPAAQEKAQTKRTATRQPAHSYRTLLTELATQTRNTTRLTGSTSTFEKLTQPTALQAEALELAAHAPVVVVQ